MSANFGVLNTFDHNIQTWKTYKGRITQYFVANDINKSSDPTGNKRKAILLSALIEGTYKLATDLVLPKNIEDVPYEDLLRRLDGHFTPKSVGFSERHNFYTATQQPGETYSQWAARLRGLTERCEFLNLEEALRDKFIIGMLSGKEKEKLYTMDLADLTLAEVVIVAENMSCARAAAAASAAGTAGMAVSTAELYKISNNSKSDSVGKVKCSACGYTNHKLAACRFANYVCRKCHVRGHLSKMCKKVNYVADCGGQGEDDAGDDGKLFYIRSCRGEPMVESIYVNNKLLKFEIDSGSTVTVISERFYKSNFKDVPLSITTRQLMTYTGSKIVCIGTIRLPVIYAGLTNDIVFYVVRDGGPPLLGRDFISRFKLQLSPVNYCNDTDTTINNLQKLYPNLFSDKLGQFNKYKVKLLLKDNVKPVFCKARTVAFALRDKVNKEIDRLVDLGILEPTEYSEYASPIVPVLKNNGSVRLCADYSVSINKQLLVEQYPLPTTTELFSKIHGGQQFSKLDLSMAYNQFVLDDESKHLTCINTNRGLYIYTRLVFGLVSAPSIFQRAIESVLSGLEGVLCLLDDILVTGKDRTEHLERLNKVLTRLQDAGLTLQKEKCSFFQDKICYLGYVITREGLHKSPEKVNAMVNAPIPTNVNQLQSFLGLVNYYRSFVPNASAILTPLYNLLRKDSKWIWTEEQDKAFQSIKELMISEQVLAHYDPRAKLILTVDASPSGLGAILSQTGVDGIERPISFVSRTLNAAEKRYAQIQKEATAIIFGVRRFHQYLYGRAEPFILRTDHKPLLTIFGPHKGIPEMSANRLQRYALFLSSYNYKIEYVRSADNSADFLSRSSLPHMQNSSEASAPGPSRQHCVECKCSDCEVAVDRATYVCFVVDGSMPVSLDNLCNETRRDRVLRQVIDFILNDWPPKVNDVRLKPFFFCRSQLSYENGCIMRGHKVVIPEILQQTILKELHSSHLGIVKTKSEARSRFWFPGIDQAIEKMIGSCDVCIQLRPSPPRAPPAFWRYPSYPFQRIHIDFLGPIKGSTFLIAVDAHTKWVEVYNMNTATSSVAVIGKLCDFMSRFGIPETIVSDNGTAFCSREVEMFCETNGIKHLTSPVYHPPSNGQAESFVKVVKKGIKCCLLLGLNSRDSSNKLLKYLMDYRNSVHTTTGLSPAQMVYGRRLRSRLDLIVPLSSTPSPPPIISDHVKNQQFMQTNTKKKNKTKILSKNDVVIYKKYTSAKYTWGKGVILKRLGKVLYLVKDKDTLEIHKRHINQLMLYKGTDNNSQDDATLCEPLPPPAPSFSPPSSPQTTSNEPQSPIPIEPSVCKQNMPSSSPVSCNSTRGRRAELYEPDTALSSPESENENEPHQQTHGALPNSHNSSPGNLKEVEGAEGKEPHVSVPAKRLLRTRPLIDFKKYF